ncbi:MAG: nitroreductase family protein [Actinomycetota bacterium]|nr:nitroreductase family protein [Actinomycetota bacterium]
MASNNFYDRILRLRALRSYRDDPPPDALIERLLEAARWTGSSKNLQNWSFIVVDGDQKERLAACGDFTAPLRAAPIALALVEEAHGYEFDTGRVAQNVMLAADALGLASCPITLHREADAGSVLGLPDGARCRYAVALGHPTDDAAPRRFGGRKPMGEVAYRNRHGESW